MLWKHVIKIGVISGILMGSALFIGGAIFSRIIYGPQFAPAGKFEPEQLNAWYFIWTKLLIGIFFGLLFTYFYQKLPLSRRINGVIKGLGFGFLFWLILSLWNISHPLVYGSINNQNELFWLLYSLCGFLTYGMVLGWYYKRMGKKQIST